MSHDHSSSTNTPISRRTALRATAAAGAAGVGMTIGAAGPVHAAQDATPAGMQSEHLEVDFTPQDPVSITRAGGGPPQRGDHFYIDGPIYAADDVGGTQIGMYQCFGAWTHAADATDAPDQRLTTVQFKLEDGSIMGLINEGGANHDDLVGAIQGGTGRYTGAVGTFRQPFLPVEEPASPEAIGGTPVAAQVVVRAVIDLMLPQSS